MSDNTILGQDDPLNNIDFLEAPETGIKNSPTPDKLIGGSSISPANDEETDSNKIDSMRLEEQARGDSKRLDKVRKLLQGISKPFKRKEEATMPPERKLEPDEKVKIDLDHPLGDKKETDKKFGINGRWVADVKASNKTFHIIDVRESGVNRDFHIIDDSYLPIEGSKKGLKGVSAFTGPVTIGRLHHTDRFEYPATVSRGHFIVEYSDGAQDGNGGLTVTNLKSDNQTMLTAHTKQLDSQPVVAPVRRTPYIEDIRTNLVEERLKDDPRRGESDENAPYGYHLNHPKLGRKSTSVDNGVYLGGTAREAILVDGKSEILKSVYEDLAQGIRAGAKDRQTMSTELMLIQVMRKVQEVMPYNGTKTTAISKEYYGDKLVGLSTYVNERAGVCRQQGLLAAYLTERLISEGFLRGGIGIERNTVEDYGGTHAWAVFKPENGKPEDTIVIDPAQDFVGTKAKADIQERWAYHLSTDDY